MQIRNNRGEVIGEINSGFTDKGDRIITNTIYDRGKVRTTDVIGGKILP